MLESHAASDSRALMARAASAALGLSSTAGGIGSRCSHCGSADHGQPFVLEHSSCGVSFSRSDGYAVAAAMVGARIGIDIEAVSAVASHPVGDVFLSADERDWIDALPPTEARRSTARLWTVKESLTKLAGTGLRVDLTRLRVQLRDGAAIVLSWPSELGLGEIPQLTLFDVSTDVVGALAIDLRGES